MEEEGLPDPDERLEFVLPIIKNLQGKKLTSVRLKEGKDFKSQGNKPTIDTPPDKILKHPVIVNRYPKIQAQQSKGLRRTEDAGSKQEGKLKEKHLAFMNMNAIWFELQHFKNERSWHNLNLPRESLQSLLLNKDWYKLYIPPEELEFKNFERVCRWKEIATALLKKYIDRYYKFKKQEWEAEFYEYHELNEEDPNFLNEYRLQVETSQQVIVDKLKELKTTLESGSFKGWSFGNLEAIYFGQYLIPAPAPLH